jgi:hypothetical protein
MLKCKEEVFFIKVIFTALAFAGLFYHPILSIESSISRLPTELEAAVLCCYEKRGGRRLLQSRPEIRLKRIQRLQEV